LNGLVLSLWIYGLLRSDGWPALLAAAVLPGTGRDAAFRLHKESGPGDDFSSGADGGMQQGDTFKLKLDQPGTYDYVCHVHAPGMAGTITVK